MGKVAYLFPAFPVFHQTFVLWEVLGLRRNGVNPKLYALWRPTTGQQPEAQQIAAEVTYLPAALSMPVLGANWRLLRAGVRRYVGLYVQVIRAWRSEVPASAREVEQAEGPVGVYDQVRGWLNSQPLLYLLKSLLLVPRAVQFAECLDGDEITHLHVHWASYPATIAYVVHLISRRPFSISAHAYDIYMVPRMLPAKLATARFVVTCAKANAAFLKQLLDAGHGNKVVVSYHGVDVCRFAPVPDARCADGCLTIISCGRLEHYKGMHHLIDACAGLRRQGIALRCWIVGDGPQHGRLERQIDKLGLGADVHLLGARPHAEVAELLRQGDLFVLASELAGKFGRRDVIANVIVEAMAAGLPVVASHVPGAEELVDDGMTGYLVPPNSVDRLSAAIAALAQNPEDRKRFGQAGRRRVLHDFDNSKNIRFLANLLMRSSDDDIERLAATV
jgi:colanic acid/amylovoran biosynthesis glycosyltransferase